jgi:hypothetical protein
VFFGCFASRLVCRGLLSGHSDYNSPPEWRPGCISIYHYNYPSSSGRERPIESISARLSPASPSNSADIRRLATLVTTDQCAVTTLCQRAPFWYQVPVYMRHTYTDTQADPPRTVQAISSPRGRQRQSHDSRDGHSSPCSSSHSARSITGLSVIVSF